MTRSRRPYDTVKRAGDIIVAALGLVALSPLLALLALLVLVTLGPPVLFTQRRPGREGQVFPMRKFRTMRAAPEGTSELAAVASDGARLTRTGRFLRATSLDELPELWNVLRGDMSLVGPRPLLVEYLERYNDTQARRHEVRPGLTGWAQVNGRNARSWEERLAMDVWYVDNRSLLLDVKILARTVGVVLGGAGVSADGADTARPFAPTDHEEDA